jgi:methylmalonyl-CoA mutase, C-terminal domain
VTEPVRAPGPARIRCVLGMLGTDVHNKGIRTLARLFRDQGIEVIYLGEHNTCDRMVSAAVAEDADIIGLSFSTASYLHYVRELMRTLADAGAADIPVMVGGLIHSDDEPELREIGVRGIFGPGSTTDRILEFVRSSTTQRPATQRAMKP